jgi:TRAP transporter TAXI family solute receptor
MKLKLKNDEKFGLREKLIIFGPAVVVAIVIFIFVYYFVDPFPPRHLSIGCGPPDGHNFIYAQAYRKLFAEQGIKLELRNTAGSAENFSLLAKASDGVDIAFVQGTMKSLAQNVDLESLGSLFFEPLWIFHHKDLALQRLPDLKGLRIAVGEEGGGTKILALRLLEMNGINSQNSRLLPYGYQKAADKLLNGEVDVAFFVSTHLASHVIQLIDSKSIKLMGLERADAYALLYHFLYVLKLPEGVIDFEENIPSRDLTLVAPTTQLVARSDMHPALVNLLLMAAKEVHRTGGEFEREGEFPSPKYLNFNLSEDAERFYKYGPPFLQRYLPFWAAILVNRFILLLLPLVAVVLPFIRLMPLIYRWRMRSRIYRWYSKLRIFDPERHKSEAAEYLQTHLIELQKIEEKVSNISVPLAFSEELYHLRLHIEMLQNKYKQMIENIENPAESGPHPPPGF